MYNTFLYITVSWQAEWANSAPVSASYDDIISQARESSKFQDPASCLFRIKRSIIRIGTIEDISDAVLIGRQRRSKSAIFLTVLSDSLVCSNRAVNAPFEWFGILNTRSYRPFEWNQSCKWDSIAQWSLTNEPIQFKQRPIKSRLSISWPCFPLVTWLKLTSSSNISNQFSQFSFWPIRRILSIQLFFKLILPLSHSSFYFFEFFFQILFEIFSFHRNVDSCDGSSVV